MIWTWQLLGLIFVSFCMCEDKGPQLTLPKTDGNISLCSTTSLFPFPSHKVFVYYVCVEHWQEVSGDGSSPSFLSKWVSAGVHSGARH